MFPLRRMQIYPCGFTVERSAFDGGTPVKI